MDLDSAPLDTKERVSLLLQPYTSKITENFMVEVDAELELYEKISLTFLLYDNVNLAYQEVIKIKMIDSKSSNLIDLIRTKSNCYNREMFLEGLSLIQNFQILDKLGLKRTNAIILFKTCTHHSIFINRTRKLLYFVCENLTPTEAELLVDSFGTNFLPKTDNCQYLEIFLLKCLVDKTITEEPYDLKALQDSLRKINKNALANCLNDIDENIDDESILVKTENDVNKEFYPIIDENNVGFCLIINQYNFEGFAKYGSVHHRLTPREGSQYDIESLKSVMTKLNIRCSVVSDIKQKDFIQTIINKINENIETDHSLFVLCVMSHGLEGSIFSSDSEIVLIEDIVQACNQLILKTKPKTIIIQACQGEAFYELQTDGLPISNTVNNSHTEDCIICVSAAPRLKSLRRVSKGTYFIQAFCEYLEKHPTDDIAMICKLVRRKLIENVEYYNGLKVSQLTETKDRLSYKLRFAQ